MEEASNLANDDTASLSSVVHKSATIGLSNLHNAGLFTIHDIRELELWTENVTIIAETRAYLQNLVVFLRMNRAVQRGVSPVATTHLELLSK